MTDEDIEQISITEGEYGIDWAQDEVPVFPYFNIAFIASDGDVTRFDRVVEKPFYVVAAFANVKAWQAKAANGPQRSEQEELEAISKRGGA